MIQLRLRENLNFQTVPATVTVLWLCCAYLAPVTMLISTYVQFAEPIEVPLKDCTISYDDRWSILSQDLQPILLWKWPYLPT